ncbi:MAG: CBS domain-containing protein [Magnetococcales bacterium]|nr:CBS domain-containing protein [Magnetococcales bacterium]
MQAIDIMMRDVITVSPDMTVKELALLLMEKKISGAPVLDGDGRLVGIVTEKDLVDRARKIHLPTLITIMDAIIPVFGERQYQNDLRKMAAVSVQDIMTENVTAVEESAELQEIASILDDEHISLLPVIRGDQLVGIIGKRDIIRGMLQDNSV